MVFVPPAQCPGPQLAPGPPAGPPAGPPKQRPDMSFTLDCWHTLVYLKSRHWLLCFEETISRIFQNDIKKFLIKQPNCIATKKIRLNKKKYTKKAYFPTCQFNQLSKLLRGALVSFYLGTNSNDELGSDYNRQSFFKHSDSL